MINVLFINILLNLEGWASGRFSHFNMLYKRKVGVKFLSQ